MIPIPQKKPRPASPLWRYLLLLIAALVLSACLFLRVCIPDSIPKPPPQATQGR